MKPNRNKARDIGFYVLLAIIIIAVVYTINSDTRKDQLDSYSELVDLFEKEKKMRKSNLLRRRVPPYIWRSVPVIRLSPRRSAPTISTVFPFFMKTFMI